jgi:hypothetical protein
MQRSLAAMILIGLVAGLTAGTANAAERSERRLIGGFLDVDLLLNNYTRIVARKYDLTDEQAEWTHAFVTEKAHGFIDKHEETIYPLVGKMFAVRQGGAMDQGELIEWGRQMQPIWQDAKAIIEESNDEFRGILTDEQKAVHDRDLELMYQSFAMTKDQLDRIVSGEMTVEEFRNPPRMRPQPRGRPANPDVAPPVAEQPPVDPVETAPAEPSTREPAMVSNNPRAATAAQPDATEREKEQQPAPLGAPDKLVAGWDKYVADFVKKYELVKMQKQKAETILKACKAQAEQYLRRAAARIESVDEQLEAAKKAAPKNEAAITQLEKQQQALLQPLQDVFEKQLKPRLEQLPTRAQRAAVAEQEAKAAKAKKK